MTTTSPTSGSFTINRNFNHPMEKVFKAFSDPATKAKWFTGPKGGDALERVIEVKTGGAEVLKFDVGSEVRHVRSSRKSCGDTLAPADRATSLGFG